MELGYVTKAEMISTVLVVLVIYNILGSMLAKLLYHIKDRTKTRADNILWSVMKKGLDKVRDGLDYLIGNPRHKR